MDSTISHIGHIDLPEDDNSKFCHLTFSHNDEVSIAFLTLGLLAQPMFIPIISGNIEGIGEITLINCNLIRFSTTYSKYYKYEYKAELIVKKMIFKSLKEIAPTTFTFTLENLNQWFFPNNFRFNDETSESYLHKDYELRIDYLSEMEITIRNRMTSRFSNDISEKREMTLIRFQCVLEDKGFSFGTVLELSRLFQKLMHLLTGKAYKIESIHCESRFWNIIYPDGEKSRRIIEISSIKNSYADHSFISDFAFTYKEIEEYFVNLVNGWYNSMDKFEYLVDLLLTYYLFPGISRKSHFMNAASAYEGLYKHLNHSKLPLGKILSETKFFIQKFYPEDVTKFIKDCKDSRNFFAHGKKDNNEYIFNDFELLYASKCLSIIGKYWFLKELGLSKELLDKKLDQSAKCFRDLMVYNKSISERRNFINKYL